MSKAPIVLFVYNRPWHTEQTITSLKENELAMESDLIIFSDGYKSESDREKVAVVREYIKTISGFKSITIVERMQNLGLANSIITGVTEVVNKYGRIIVLEDDMVTSKYFLRFMNEALEFYKNEEKVISIHGYIYPIKAQLPETFFIKDTGCWGWATWKRGWKLFEPNGKSLLDKLKEKQLTEKFDINGSYNFTEMLSDQIKGKNNSWAIRWQASAFLNDKLTLFPGKSLLMNIGHDNSGSHCGHGSCFDVKLTDAPINVQSITVEENQFAVNELARYFKSIAKNRLQKIIDRLRRLFSVRGILKPIYYEGVRHIYHLFKDKNYRTFRLLEFKLGNLPRFTECNFKVDKWNISIPDSASFLSAYNEIFVKKIYSFRADGDSPSILDLGANVGLSILFFKQLYPKSKITALEADPKIFGYLKRNIHGNGLTDVEIINEAAWHENTILRFHPDGADGGKVVARDGNNFIEIRGIDIRDILKARQFDFLKMDIEGAEEVVLSACRDYLSEIRFIFVEYHSATDRKQNLNQIVGILTDAGFRIHIQSVMFSSSPFITTENNSGFDLQLNVFGWRE